jgi:hypothetical protein
MEQGRDAATPGRIFSKIAPVFRPGIRDRKGHKSQRDGRMVNLSSFRDLAL